MKRFVLWCGLLLLIAAADGDAAESTLASKTSLAVLPFAVQNADAALADAFAQRLSDALVACGDGRIMPYAQVLGRLAELGVPPERRASTGLSECRVRGRQLGVDAVLCGGVWGRDKRHVVSARIADVPTDTLEIEMAFVAKTPDALLDKAKAVAEAVERSRARKRKPEMEDEPEPTPQELLAQARQDEAEARWDKAFMAYRQVRLTSLADKALDERIRACRARLMLDLRYKSDEYAQSVEELSRSLGLFVLRALLRKIEVCYVTRQQPRKLLKAAGKQIVMLSESASARDRFPALKDEASRARVVAAGRALAAAPLSGDALDPAELTTAVAQYLLDAPDAHLPAGVLISEAIFGIVSALDKYSVYLSADSLKELEIQTSGRFTGIGAEVGMRGPLLTVITPILGSPASRAGIRPGDRVITIDGEWGPPDLTLTQAVKRLRGRWHAPVELEVLTEGAAFPAPRHIVRNFVSVASVKESRILQGCPGIGYVRLVSFRQRSTQDVEAALAVLERHNMKALVLDLRGNGGGLLTAAVGVSDLFVSKGMIVSTRGRIPSSTREYRAHAKGTHDRCPVAILVNGRSASASEIVASVIRDHKRGPLVGTRTVGKGSVQGMFRFVHPKTRRTLAGADLTVARYFPPCGKSFDGIGIVPDFVVDLDRKARGKLMRRKARRWIRRNVPGYKSKLSSWRSESEADAKVTDIELDAQLATAVDALKRTLDTGTWLANDQPPAHP